MAVRVPDVAAFEIIRGGTERIVEVSDDEIADAIRFDGMQMRRDIGHRATGAQVHPGLIKALVDAAK